MIEHLWLLFRLSNCLENKAQAKKYKADKALCLRIMFSKKRS